MTKKQLACATTLLVAGLASTASARSCYTPGIIPSDPNNPPNPAVTFACRPLNVGSSLMHVTTEILDKDGVPIASATESYDIATGASRQTSTTDADARTCRFSISGSTKFLACSVALLDGNLKPTLALAGCTCR